jgi:hypothetical protein
MASHAGPQAYLRNTRVAVAGHSQSAMGFPSPHSVHKIAAEIATLAAKNKATTTNFITTVLIDSY